MTARETLNARHRTATLLKYGAVALPLVCLAILPRLGDFAWNNQIYAWIGYIVALYVFRNIFDTNCPHCECRTVTPSFPQGICNLKHCSECGEAFDGALGKVSAPKPTADQKKMSGVKN